MRWRRDPALWVLVLALIGLMVWAGLARGWLAVWEGLHRGGVMLVRILPLLLGAFWLVGLVEVLFSAEWVAARLGRGAGWRGVLLAALVGGVMPGGPYAYYPIAAVLLRNGAGVGAVLAFVTAKNYWSFTRLPVEVALWGLRLTVIRFLLTLALPPLLGIAAEALLGRRLERIRVAQPEEEQ